MLGAKHPRLEVGWFGRLTAGGAGVQQLMRNRSLRDDVTRLLVKLTKATTHDEALDAAKTLFVRMLKTRGMGIAFVTRFLVVSRPELFFSVNSAAVSDLARLFGVTQSELKTWDGYARALRLVWKSKWYNSKRPKAGLAAKVWAGRVALLDAYAYDGR
jgi:hypothetical protein